MRPASPPLARSVRAFWAFDDDGKPQGAGDERIVADGCAEIVVHFGDCFGERTLGGYAPQPRALFAGQISAPLWLRPGRHVDVFGVRFEPGGARRLGLPPQWMLADRRIAVEEVLPQRCRQPWRDALERMALARGFAARVTAMESFLRATLAPAREDATEACVAAIASNTGAHDLAHVAARAGLSSRQMQRRFLADIGVTPKLFARIVRFQSAFVRWGEEPSGWAAVAADCGYFDQPHLLRDFRQFAGQPPTAFLASLAPLGAALVGGR
jgi:AraC-like DNA-binding protein